MPNQWQGDSPNPVKVVYDSISLSNDIKHNTNASKMQFYILYPIETRRLLKNITQMTSGLNWTCTVFLINKSICNITPKHIQPITKTS